MTPRLTVGPIQYFWSAEKKHDFYARIADEAPVETVYLGEVVCSKRQPFHDPHLPAIVDRLERAGKRVVHSGLAEVMLRRERQACEALSLDGDTAIEINNAAGLYHLESGRVHRIGPFLNVYNAETLAHLAARGADHVTLPTEMPAEAIAEMCTAAARLGLGLEVQVFGRASLATSARCYHARAHRRTKDNCQFVCAEDPDGMPLATRDGTAFLRVNGIQTLSHTYVALHAEVPVLAGMGVTDLRLMPQDVDMVTVAQVFDDIRRGRLDTAEAGARLDALKISAPFSNGFFHGAAGYRRIAAATRALS